MNYATSVNHPLFLRWYVTEVMPLLCQVTAWPADYMPGCLSKYLLHHKAALAQWGIWDAHAAAFVQKHKPLSMLL